MFRITCLVALSIIFIGCSQPNPNAKNETPNPTKSGGLQLQEKTVGDIKLKPIQALPSVEALIPDGFAKMTDEMLATKYPSNNRPTIVYTNPSGSVNIAFDHTANSIAPNQLDQLHKQLDSSIRQAQPNANWMFTGFQHYNGRKWTQLEFQSMATDTKIHNIMIATSASNRMLAISFNCTDELAEKWLKVGREIIKSVIVTDG